VQITCGIYVGNLQASNLQLVGGVELASASDAGIDATPHISRQSGRVAGVLDSINALD
jgi:hypothetical protein